MHKRICALMMTLCLLLTACSGGESAGRGSEETALDIRASFLGMTSCTATLEVTADYGQRVYEYNMEFSWAKEGDTVLTVTAPETIAGVTARITNGSAVVEYDGVSLETGPLDTEGLSPVGAVPALMTAVREGYMAEVSTEAMGETECLRVTYRDPEGQPGTGTELTAWFDLATQNLVRGEISSDGAMVIKCVFTSFALES